MRLRAYRLVIKKNQKKTGHKSAECRWRVAGVGEDNLKQKFGGVWIVGSLEEIKVCQSKFWAHVDRDEEKEGTGRMKCRSKYWTSEDRRDGLCVTREPVRDEFSNVDQRDELSKIREEQRDWFSKIREG